MFERKWHGTINKIKLTKQDWVHGLASNSTHILLISGYENVTFLAPVLTCNERERERERERESLKNTDSYNQMIQLTPAILHNPIVFPITRAVTHNQHNMI